MAGVSAFVFEMLVALLLGLLVLVLVLVPAIEGPSRNRRRKRITSW